MCVIALKEGRAMPTQELVSGHVREALRSIWTASGNREAFLEDPRRHPILREAWYNERVPAEVIDRVRDKLDACIANLLGCSIWKELVACGPERILIADTKQLYRHAAGIDVHAAPDLVFRPAPSSGQGTTESSSCVIVDWKTGQSDGARHQLAAYALYARDVLGVPFPGRGWEGRAYGLADRTVQRYFLGAGDLDRASTRIRESAEAMQHMLVDARSNVPRPQSDFPLINSAMRSVCRFCPFFELCEGELTETGPGAPLDASRAAA
jgi:hypothetical protein